MEIDVLKLKIIDNSLKNIYAMDEIELSHKVKALLQDNLPWQGIKLILVNEYMLRVDLFKSERKIPKQELMRLSKVIEKDYPFLKGKLSISQLKIHTSSETPQPNEIEQCINKII